VLGVINPSELKYLLLSTVERKKPAKYLIWRRKENPKTPGVRRTLGDIVLWQSWVKYEDKCWNLNRSARASSASHFYLFFA
jgi:hypothetical protein